MFILRADRRKETIIRAVFTKRSSIISNFMNLYVVHNRSIFIVKISLLNEGSKFRNWRTKMGCVIVYQTINFTVQYLLLKVSSFNDIYKFESMISESWEFKILNFTIHFKFISKIV